MPKGKFFAIEGSDGSGSSTQCKLLADYLSDVKQRKVHVTAEPSSGPIGKIIRDFLSGKIKGLKFSPHIFALAFAADRLHHYESEILPKLNNNTDVISDRYTLSSLVYQGKDLDLEWVKNLNKFAPLADYTVLVHTPEEIAKTRRDSRAGVEEIFDDSKQQIEIQKRYLNLGKELFGAVVIDGSPSAEDVFESLKKELKV